MFQVGLEFTFLAELENGTTVPLVCTVATLLGTPDTVRRGKKKANEILAFFFLLWFCFLMFFSQKADFGVLHNRTQVTFMLGKGGGGLKLQTSAMRTREGLKSFLELRDLDDSSGW